jgi:opacity protein-like surface antigen
LLALAPPTFIRDSHAADGGQASPKGKVENVVGFKLGGYIPQSSDLENFGIGGHGEASVGWNLSQYFGIGTAIGLFQTNNTTNVLVSQGGTLTSVSTDQTVRSTYLILNATLMIPAGAFVPYVEGGGGYYFTHIKESSSASNSKDDTSFGYHAGAGLNWFFTKDYYIGLGGRYIWTKTNDLNIRLDGVLADVNLGIRF